MSSSPPTDPTDQLPESWLRGPIPGIHPLIAPSLYGFQQAREDLAKYTEGLSTDQIWVRPHGFGFGRIPSAAHRGKHGPPRNVFGRVAAFQRPDGISSIPSG